MIEIEHLENWLWEYFGRSHHLMTCGDRVITVQDLGPDLADFLHEQGVSIDWSDGSRYGTKVNQNLSIS